MRVSLPINLPPMLESTALSLGSFNESTMHDMSNMPTVGQTRSIFNDGFVSINARFAPTNVSDVTKLLRSSISHLEHCYQPHPDLTSAAGLVDQADRAAAEGDLSAFACLCYNAGLLVGGAVVQSISRRNEAIVIDSARCAALVKKRRSAAEGLGYDEVDIMIEDHRLFVIEFDKVRSSYPSDLAAFKAVASTCMQRLSGGRMKHPSYRTVARAVAADREMKAYLGVDESDMALSTQTTHPTPLRYWPSAARLDKPTVEEEPRLDSSGTCFSE